MTDNRDRRFAYVQSPLRTIWLAALVGLWIGAGCKPVPLGDDDDQQGDDDDFVSGDDDDVVPGDDDDQVGDDDDDPDSDGDGWTVGGGDCNDSDPDVHPGATEIQCNGVDDDCSGGDSQQDLVATFGTDGHYTEHVELAFDEESGLLKAAFLYDFSDQCGACAGEVNYRTYDETLTLQRDVELPFDDVLCTDEGMALWLDDDGSPSIYMEAGEKIVRLAPTNATETSWSNQTILDGYSAEAVDVCAPLGTSWSNPAFAWTDWETLYYCIPDGSTWDCWYHEEEWATSVTMSCRSDDEVAFAVETSDGLEVRVRDIPAESSTTEVVTENAGRIVGAHSRYGGEPWVLFHTGDWTEEGASIRASWMDNDDWTANRGFGTIPVNGFSHLGGAAYSEDGLGHLAYIYDNDVFYYIEYDFLGGTYDTWDNDDQDWRYSSVTVDDLGRAWILYGNYDEYKLWLKCPE